MTATQAGRLTSRDSEFDLAILCGYGILPIEIARAASAAGRKPFLVGIEGEAESAIEQFPFDYLSWGQVGRLLKLLEDRGISQIVFAGGVRRRPELHKLKLDWVAIRSLPQIVAFLVGGDNNVLSGSIRMLESHGLTVVGAHEIAPGLLTTKGRIAGVAPNRQDIATMTLGFRTCKALGSYDVGQAVVAEANRIVALEGVEGTDLMLKRVEEMRRIGRMPPKGRNGVLVKTMKPGQDMRADLPAIGPDTVEGVSRAGLHGIALEAGRTLILEREKTLAAAQAAGIYIYGIAGPDETGGRDG